MRNPLSQMNIEHAKTWTINCMKHTFSQAIASHLNIVHKTMFPSKLQRCSHALQCGSIHNWSLLLNMLSARVAHTLRTPGNHVKPGIVNGISCLKSCRKWSENDTRHGLRFRTFLVYWLVGYFARGTHEFVSGPSRSVPFISRPRQSRAYLAHDP